MLYGLYRQTEGVRLDEARQQLTVQCTRIVQRYVGVRTRRVVATIGGKGKVGGSGGAVGTGRGAWPGGRCVEPGKRFIAYAYPT